MVFQDVLEYKQNLDSRFLLDTVLHSADLLLEPPRKNLDSHFLLDIVLHNQKR
jgi:hypothetical protein